MNFLTDRILITGGTGLVGVSVTNRLKKLGCNVISCGNTRGAVNYNLLDGYETKSMFDDVNPKIVIHLAARVGGIYANMTKKSSFYLENTLINTNVMKEIQERKIEYVIAMGTGCAYPKKLEGEILHEYHFLDGIPEPTNDAYAYAKRNLLVHLEACREDYGLKYCYCIPANLYGENDNFHPLNSHVVPALIRKFVEAEKKKLPFVNVWGNGLAERDFLYIEDLTDAIMLFLSAEIVGVLNIATGLPVTIDELAYTIKKILDYNGDILYSTSFPVGQKTRLFNTSRIQTLGWKPNHSLEEGLIKTIEWFEKITYKKEIA
jgi:GDP-L-fucose synthase